MEYKDDDVTRHSWNERLGRKDNFSNEPKTEERAYGPTNAQWNAFSTLDGTMEAAGNPSVEKIRL